MVIHIAPIGKETEHVIQWLKEITPVEKVWLLHSKKGKLDFPKRALELEKKIKSFYDDCDVQRKTINDSFGLDPSSVHEKISDKTRAIIPVHYGGKMCKIKELKQIASDFKLKLIEDAAEAFARAMAEHRLQTNQQERNS